MTGSRSIEDVLRADPADIGCDAGMLVLDEYVERELEHGDAGKSFPGLAAHLRACPACRLDHDGLLNAVRAERAPI